MHTVAVAKSLILCTIRHRHHKLDVSPRMHCFCLLRSENNVLCCGNNYVLNTNYETDLRVFLTGWFYSYLAAERTVPPIRMPDYLYLPEPRLPYWPKVIFLFIPARWSAAKRELPYPAQISLAHQV